MATNLKIDDSLIDEALSLSGLSTKREAVTLALQEFVIRQRQKQFLELLGQFEFDPEFDYKAQRRAS
jgi:Arc/MetJ family transcription regulator